MSTVLVCDANNLFHRSYHATIAAGMTTVDGVPSGALYGVINTLRSLCRELHPTHMLWLFDNGGSDFRLGMDPDYKGHRKTAQRSTKTPADPATDLPPQFDGFCELLDLIGIRHYSEKGVEADDLIAQVVHRWREELLPDDHNEWRPAPITVVSGDHDMFQLIRDNVQVLRPGQPKAHSGIGLVAKSTLPGELFDEEAVLEKYGVPPKKLPELWALTGDSGDNVKGIPGVGPKTAAKWLNEHGDLWSVLWREEKCAGFENTCRVGLQMIQLDGKLGNVPYTLDECEMPTAVDPAPVVEFFERWQMRSLTDVVEREGNIA